MITGVILAGGLSKRMGQDKGLLELNGKTMVEHIHEKLQPVADPIILVTNRPESYHKVAHTLSVQMIEDEIPQLGPLSGIHAALGKSENPYIMAIACDMPYADPAWFIAKAQDFMHEGYQAIIGQTNDGRLQPLHAIYHTDCRETIERLLLAQDLKISNLVNQVKAKIIPLEERQDIFYNMNTPEDYHTAKGQA